MKNTYSRAIQILVYNFKTLIFFETMYRAIGIVLIYPLVRMIFNVSITMSGYTYITNAVFLDFILKPTTLFMIFILVIICSIYITIELVFLAFLFDLSYHQESIKFVKFLILGTKRALKMLIKYHFLIIIPSLLFLIIILSSQILGIVAIIDIPDYLRARILTHDVLPVFFYIFLFICIISFIETIFSLQLFTLSQTNFNNALKLSRNLLKKRRIKMIFQFITVNLVTHLALYILYIFVILLLGLFFKYTKDQEYVLGFLLTILYSTYSIIGLMASVIIIPLNFSLVSSWYFEHVEPRPSELKANYLHQVVVNAINTTWLKRGIVIVLLLLFILNLSSVFAIVTTPNDRLELLGNVEIVAHRGASRNAPENTLSAIEYAITQGADAVEFDVRLTKDNVPVLFHDDTVVRTTNAYQRIRLDQMVLDELKALDAGSWFSSDFINERIPTLEEALILIDQRIRIFVDIKTNSDMMHQTLISLIEMYEMEDFTTVLSTNKEQLETLKGLNERIKTLLLITSFYGDINQISQSEFIDFIGIQHHFIENAYGIIAHLQRNGKRVYAWTVSDTRDMEKVLKFGLDGMITSRPYLAKEVIYKTHSSDLIYSLLHDLFT